MAEMSVATEGVVSLKSALANVPPLIVMVRAVPNRLDWMISLLAVEFPDTVLPFKSKKLPFNVSEIPFDALKDRLSPKVVVPADRVSWLMSLPPVVNVPVADRAMMALTDGV